MTHKVLPEDSSSVKRLRFSRWFVWFVWAYFVFILVILSLAFFMLLFGANTGVGFVDWVYRSADRAMEPFRGIFPTATAGGESIIDFSILFAIIVYGIIAMAVQALVNFIDRKIAEEQSTALYVAQEEQRRREVAQASAAQQAAAQQQAAMGGVAARLAVEQTAAQQRTADAAERLAAEQQHRPSPPPPQS